MPWSDLRDFLDELDRHRQLLVIDDEVTPEPDLGAAGAAVNRLGDQAPALLFRNVRGFNDARVAMNVLGSWSNHALMLGLPKSTPIREQFFVFAERWQRFPVEVERRRDAPFQEIPIREGINLFEQLPVFRLNAGDGGFFIDKGCVITRDPSDPAHFGKQNVGIYRLQVKGRTRLGIQVAPQHDLARHLAIAERTGRNLPVAIAVGCDPVITLMAGTPLAYDQSEYAMAGAIRGEPYPIARAPLTGLDVPWGAEFVIEGEILAGVREYEGPFGEFTGHYTGGRNTPVIEVRCVSHRQRPIFEHLYLGIPWTEVDYMIGLNTSVPLYAELKQAYPDEVVAVNAMWCHGLVAIVSLRSRFGGFARSVALRLMSTPHGLGYCKVVILVDDYVDPFDLQRVMWAIATKVHPRHDVFTIPNLPVVSLDPSSEPPGMTDKLVIDATTPVHPDARGRFARSPLVEPRAESRAWEQRLNELFARLSDGRGPN